MIDKHKIKFYKDLQRGEWAELKLKEISSSLPNRIISDIGSGFGWFGPIIKNMDLKWQPFDYIRKIDEAQIWDLNNPAPVNCKAPGGIIFLEVLEHLSNPELAIKNISNHIEKNGFIAVSTPNPFFTRSKITMLFKDQLYAFQPKHLKEHHVFVPLPHVVVLFFKNHGFELMEYAVLGKSYRPKFSWRLNLWKAWLVFFLTQILGFRNRTSVGPTQAFLFKKTD